MLIVNSEQIKGAVIKDTFPEIMKSVKESITDDSKDVLKDSVKEIEKMNKKLEKSIKEMNQYMSDLVDVFKKMDQDIGNAM